MKTEQNSGRDEAKLREAAKFLNIDYQKLEKEGQVKQLLDNGITKALPVKIKLAIGETKNTYIDTTARLVLANDKEGNRTVNVLLKDSKPKLDRYQNIELTKEQQKDLQNGRTLVVKDATDREHLIKFDRELNRVGGMKKSIFLVPERLGSSKEGYTKLTNGQQSSLKQGEAVNLEVGGKKVTAQLDPIERKLNVQETPKQVLDLKPTDWQRKPKVGPSL